ncbi:HAMP domain-containing histidine kinase [Alkaliphilus pronyensis]|uniref:histidine kinase n=2 Tax=Alkaliphilus pronyensis TaxID=1482732 RepID=A0A6I0F8U7_9FIRM|nr:HAMP domain-containing histidine kinase [Alkaliphilus pronyensis]
MVNLNYSNVAKGEAILASYGLEEDEIFQEITILKGNSNNNLFLIILLTLIIYTTLTIIFFVFVKKLFIRVNEVTDYVKSIQGGNYNLDIRDNYEGDISILKNEIYKITTMLKEQTEKLKLDKISLANSLADISHQLKTPMTSMYVLNDLLSNNPDDDVKIKFHNKIRNQLKRMEWLITSLLKISKIDAGTVTMKREEVNVKALIDKSLEVVSIPLDIKMQTVEIEGIDRCRFIGDFNWSCEAVINILKNCIEHTDENGIIKIFFEENPIYTSIIISDNGKGIAKDDIPYIFNRFYRGKNAREESVGIGLAMAKAIIDGQGGDITVESQIGKGTQFIIKFFKAFK